MPAAAEEALAAATAEDDVVALIELELIAVSTGPVPTPS